MSVARARASQGRAITFTLLGFADTYVGHWVQQDAGLGLLVGLILQRLFFHHFTIGAKQAWA